MRKSKMYHSCWKYKKFLMLKISAHDLFIKFQIIFFSLILPLNVRNNNIFFGFLAAVDILYLLITPQSLKKIKTSLVDPVLLLYFVIHFAFNINFEGIQRIIQLIILLMTFYINKYVADYTEKDYSFALKILTALIFLSFIKWITDGFRLRFFGGFFGS